MTDDGAKDENEPKPAGEPAGEPAEEEDGEDGEEEGRSRPFGWVGLVVILVLVVGGWFLITTLYDDTKMQDCIQSGRRNCAPIDTLGR